MWVDRPPLRALLTAILLVVAAPVLGAETPPPSSPAPSVQESRETRPSRLTARSYGAAGQVSGSLHVLDTGNGRWMIDCGAIYDDADADDASPHDAATEAGQGDSGPNTSRPAASELDTVGQGGAGQGGAGRRLPLDATRITALMLTHAHADHCGRLPILVEEGFRGPIHMTEATAALARVMLLGSVLYDRDRARRWIWSASSLRDVQSSGRRLIIHWQGCKYQQGIGHRNELSKQCTAEALFDHFDAMTPRVKARLCDQCCENEVNQIMARVTAMEFGRMRRVAPGVRVTYRPAGHIPGAASVLFEVDIAGTTRRMLYSGDLGNELSPLMPGPVPAPPVDAVFVEGTYGATRRDPAVAGQRAEFRRLIGRLADEEAIIWIPAFALDRSQKILHELRLAQDEGLLPEQMPIYLPSPSARAFTKLYERNLGRGWFQAALADDPRAFRPRNLRHTVPSAAKLPRPCVIISITDVTLTGWMRSLLRNLLPQPSTQMVFVGYVAPESATGQLKSGARQLEVDGRTVDVRAGVHSFQCFSGHGDATDIDRWLAAVPNDSPIVLIHGEREALEARATQLRRVGREKVLVADPGRTIDLLELIDED